MTIRKALLLVEMAVGLGYAVVFWGMISIFWIPTGLLFVLISGDWRQLVGAWLYFPGLFFLFELAALALTNAEKWRIKYFPLKCVVFVVGNVCLISASCESPKLSPQEMLFVIYMPIAVIIHLLILVKHHAVEPSDR